MPPHTDPARFLGAVTRTVAHRDHDGRPARVIVAARSFDTTVDDLWGAITTADRIARWFLPISGELRLGGRYQLQGHAGGEVTTCEPPHHFAATWEYGGDVSWIDVRVTADGGRARVAVEHVAYVADDRWDQFGPGAVGVGWDMILFGIDNHLGSGAGVDPSNAMAWLVSEDGRAFVRYSSDDWARASVADGTDPEAARGAAERTTTAYGGG